MKTKIVIAGIASALLLATSALASGSVADPSGTPFGLTTQSDAKGQKLDGVVAMEFVMIDQRFASEARVLLRLRKGSQLGTLFSSVAGPIDTDDVQAVQEALFLAIAARVKAKFFPEECGAVVPPGVDPCPAISLVLKDVEEVGTADDAVSSLYVIGNIVLSATEPTK